MNRYIFCSTDYNWIIKLLTKIKCTLCKGHFEKEPRQLVEAAVCILQAAAFLNSIAHDNDCN
ncbi:hypothetical protein, partial [Ureibacillus chungkukjangi]|uniref:hypothetical protein n=1 Tax=Ureibacillus chungkukjangi TaxID=1202712 RepID=UPI00203FFC25